MSLGSNKGDKKGWLTQAMERLATLGHVFITSSFYASQAWGLSEQPDFINMCAGIETELSPKELLAAIQHIEADLGRERLIKWGPRTLDIDILLYDDLILTDDELVIPHPYMHQRHFVLAPLAEIAPLLVHPLQNKTISELLQACADELQVVLC